MLIDLDLYDLLEAFEPNPLVAHLHAKQVQAYNCTERFRCNLWGRRTGKSYLDAVKLMGGQTGEVSLYCAKTVKSAKNIMMPAFRAINFQYDLGLSFNMSDYSITEQNGAVIRLAGIKDESAAENLRGPKYRRVIIDESGTIPSELLQYAVEDVLQPALIDSNGDLLLSGTPGEDPDPKDYWFSLTGDPASGIPGSWPTSHATIFDNTKIPDPRPYLVEVMAKNNWTPESATYRREIMAEWVPDVGSIVFDYQGDFEKGPDMGLTVLAVDFGVVDHTSFTVLRQPRETRPHVWVMQCYTLEDLDIIQIRDHIQALRSRWHPNHILGDGGGLGLGYILTLDRQFNIPIKRAEKQHLRARIDMGRGMSAAGLVHLTPEAQELHNEWKKLPWNGDRSGFHEKYKADGCLVGETMISTPGGERRIDAVREGDLVMTPVGPRPVKGHWMTNPNAETFAAQLSNGETLRGTPNHPVFVQGSGWVPLALLEHDDILVACHEGFGSSQSSASASPITVSSTDAIRSHPTATIESTGKTASMGFCTESSGKRHTDQFPRATRFITSTTTRSTIDSITSNAFLLSSMSENILSRERTSLHLHESEPPSGTDQRPATLGTSRTESWPCSAPSGGSTSANSAAASSKANAGFPASAPQSASLPSVEHPEKTTSPGHVKSAELPSQQTDTSGPGPAPVRVLSVSRTENAATWNMSVDDCPIYFASGVLTHNTDGFLYALQLINALEPYQPPKDERTEAQRIRDIARANAMRAANRAMNQRRAG